MASGTYYGFWDYWELYHKVTFDGVNKIIYINPGETDINVQTDLYSDWKEWLRLEDYMKYVKAFDVVGGEPTVGTERLDATFFLINGWKIQPYPGSYTLNIKGNLFDVDGENTTLPADKIENLDNNILINTNTSVIVRQVRETVTQSIFNGDEIVSASLFGAQEAALYDIQGTVYNISGSIIEIQNLLQQPLTASLTAEYQTQLNNIETLAQSQSIELQLLSSTNVTQSQQLNSLISTNTQQSSQLSSLVSTNASQSAQIQLLENKILEIWELHGLDVTKPLTVTQLARTFGAVSQSIVTTGTGSLQRTIITRV